MTLLLGARGPNHAVVLSDSLSTHTDGDGKITGTEMVQKLFASKRHPYLIGAHGLNRLGAVHNHTMIPEMIESELDHCWFKGLNVSIAKIIDLLDANVTQHLKSNKVRGVYGLWLAGKWPCTPKVEITEVIWFWSEPERLRVEIRAHGPVVMAGSGFDYLGDYLKGKPFDDELKLDKVYDKPVEYSLQVVKRLYALAEKKQEDDKKNLFGGQKWIALVTKDGVDLGKVD